MDDTSKELLFRSAIRPKDPCKKPNEQLLLIEEDDNPPDDTMDAVIFHSEGLSGVQVDTVLDTNLPPELMDRAILVEGEEDDSALGSQIADNLREHDKVCLDKIKEIIKDSTEEQKDGLRDYHENLQGINDDQGNPVWKIKKFDNHAGPYTMRNPEYLGSMWNILVHWDDGTKDWQNLDILAAQVPDMCAQYAIDNKLLHKEGWK